MDLSIDGDGALSIREKLLVQSKGFPVAESKPMQKLVFEITGGPNRRLEQPNHAYIFADNNIVDDHKLIQYAIEHNYVKPETVIKDLQLRQEFDTVVNYIQNQMAIGEPVDLKYVSITIEPLSNKDQAKLLRNSWFNPMQMVNP